MNLTAHHKLNSAKIGLLLVVGSILLGLIWFSWANFSWDNFYQELMPSSSYNIGNGFPRDEWKGVPFSTVVEKFDQPLGGYPTSEFNAKNVTCTFIYPKEHFMFSVRDGVIEQAYDRKKLDQKFLKKFKKGKRLSEWVGKSSSELIATFGTPSLNSSSKICKLPYYTEKDRESTKYWLWLYKDDHKQLAFHVRDSDQVVVSALDRSKLSH